MFISVIIPCYNEEKIIISTIKKIDFYLKLKKYEYEIIVIDDGSSDKTVEKLIKLMKSHKHLFFVTYSPNKGKGFAVRKGLILSKYKNKLILDADLSVSIVHLSRISLESKGYRIIKGQRVQTIKQPFYRILVGKIWKMLVFIRTGLFMDSQCLLPNELILYKSKERVGIEKISRLYNKKNLEFYSLNGFQKIKKFMKRNIDEEIYNITTEYGKKLNVTKNHPLLLQNKNLYGENKKMAKDLNINDKLYKVKKINLINLVNEIWEISLINNYQKSKIFYEDKQYFRLKYGRHKVLKKIILDREFFFMLGLFIAEGSVSSNKRIRLSWSFHKNEKKYINFIKRYWEKYGVKPYTYKSGKNCVVVCITSKIIYDFFLKYNLSTKNIPNLLFNVSTKKRWVFIDGLLCGDGNLHKVKGRKNMFLISLASNNEMLISSLNYLLLTLGIECRITKSYRLDNFKLKRKGQLQTNTNYSLNILSGYLNKFINSTENFKDKYNFNGIIKELPRKSDGLKIKKIEKTNYKGLVYNVSLENPNFFLSCDAFFTHNCPFTLLKLPDKFYKSLEIDGFAFDVEILFKAKQACYPIKKVNVIYENKPDSKVTLRKTIAMFFELLRI